MPPAAAPPPPPQHGVKGVYYAGEWLDFENLNGKFNVSEDSCSGCDHKEACPRSKSRNTATPDADGVYDVCIIGAGCIGAAVARQLASYKLSVVWLEAADDVSQGATKGNSGIVHAGYDDEPGSNHAKFCWKGNQMFPDLDRDLRFGYQLNGSLVLATKESDREILKELLERGKTNGVQRLRILEKKELFEMEPYLNPNVIAALYSPDAGNVIPYEFTIALAENSVDNGVELRIRREVTAITANDKGLTISISHWEPKPYFDSIRKYQWTTGRLATIGAVWAATLACVVTMGDSIQSYAIVALCLLYIGYEVSKTGKISKSTPLSKLVEQAGDAIGTDGKKVLVEDMKVGGSGSSRIMDGVTVQEETITAKYVINCAGGASDKIAKMIGDDSFKIKPRVGDYLLLNRNQVSVSWCAYEWCDSRQSRDAPTQQSAIYISLLWQTLGSLGQTYSLPVPRSRSWKGCFGANHPVGQSHSRSDRQRHAST
jgi:glycine/D-amino acid oxidase-like deaminating enzyme